MSRAVTIFNFHGVGEPTRPLGRGEEDVWLTQQQFEGALDVLADAADVRITFDDGNRSDLAIALPELQRRGLVAEFFVLAGKLEEPGYLSREDVKRLHAEGMQVGSHGMHHRRWTEVSADELRDEVAGAKAILEDLTGEGIEHAACPFGCYNRRVLRALRAASFRRVYTSDCGRAREREWVQARNTLHRADPRAEIARAMDGRQRRMSALRTGIKRTLKRWL